MTEPNFRALCSELVELLGDIHSLVWGEAPHLLDEDRGENARLDIDIEGAIERFAEADRSPPGPLWGRPTIEPVPVSERLPGPEDCDEEGVCWWWHPDHRDEEFGDGWILLKSEWADGHHDADYSLIYTHWLPHWALPVPQQEVE